MKVLPERDVFNLIPAQPHSQAQPATRQDVQRGGLLGHQGRLPLRQNEDAGHEPELRRTGCHEAVQHEGFEEGRQLCVRSLPAPRSFRIGAEHMVIGHDVRVAKRFRRLGVIAHRRRIGWVLRLGIDHTEVKRHGVLSSTYGLDRRWQGELWPRRRAQASRKLCPAAFRQMPRGRPRGEGFREVSGATRNAALPPARGRRRAWRGRDRKRALRRPRTTSPSGWRPG